MAAADNAITIKDDIAMELPSLPANQGVEALKDIIFGSAAGMAGKLIEYPFDTVKVRLQSQPDHLPLRYAGPLDCFRQSLQTEGVRGLYRGISAPMAGAAVETSSLFFSYRILQETMKATVCSSTDPLPLSALLVCGALSGSFTSLLLTPIELIKCKMQVPADAPGRRPPGIVSLIASVFRHQGVLGFWRGQLGTLIRETGGSAAWFGSYEGMSALFRKYSKHTSSARATAAGSTKEAQLPLYQQMMAGAVAGVSYNFVFYPADTIKSRMQTEDVVRSAGKGERLTFWGVGQSLWKQQGLKGLYRGCGITVCRSAPSSAFIFSIYEGLRQYFG